MSNVERITLPVIEETVRLDKRTKDKGGWRITRRTGTRDELVEATLRGEDVVIERRPIDRVVDQIPAPRYEGDTLVVPVVEERLVTERRLVLVEEVHVKRVPYERRERQTLALRKDEIMIDRLVARPDLPPTPTPDPIAAKAPTNPRRR